MPSERLDKELAKHPKPWTSGKEYNEILDANGKSIDCLLLLYHINELEHTGVMQAKILRGLQENVKHLTEKLKQWNDVVERLCKTSDHDMCIFCKAIFPKSKPEPCCNCVAVGTDGRVYDT